MINRNIKKALDLIGMQIHTKNTVRTRGINQIGYQFSGNRNTRLIFTILTRISIIRNNRRNAFSRSPAAASIKIKSSIKFSFVGGHVG